jgi:hypothetical protein
MSVLREHMTYLPRRIRHWWRRRIELVRWAYQRVRYGYDDRAIWSLDTYLADWVPTVLRRMKDCGYPAELAPEVWNAHLEDMAAGIESHHERNWSDWYNKREETEARSAKGLQLFAEWFGSLWT